MIHKNFDCTLYLIRHGESESNTKPHLVGGRSPSAPLTALGRGQARRLGDRLRDEGVRFDAIYCSTLLRARQTAALMVGRLRHSLYAKVPTVKYVPALVELSQGDWEGRPRAKAYTTAARLAMGYKTNQFVPPNGESQRMVERRVSGWLEDEILHNRRFIARHSKATVAVVSHGTALKCLLHYALGFDSHLIWRVAMDNCAVSKLRFDSMGWHLDSVNDACHTRWISFT